MNRDIEIAVLIFGFFAFVSWLALRSKSPVTIGDISPRIQAGGGGDANDLTAANAWKAAIGLATGDIPAPASPSSAKNAEPGGTPIRWGGPWGNLAGVNPA